MEKKFDLTPDTKNQSSQNTSANKPENSELGSLAPSSLTAAEVKDPNLINVVISDPSPIIILFGAGASGKTMTLIRMTRWLKKQGYKVEPDRKFRPSDSVHYKEMCDTFDTVVNDDMSASGNSDLDFMLVRVMNKYGEPLCQILEAPGEHYFSSKIPNNPFPRYINTIRNLDNPKTWMFIVEYDWKDSKDRLNYANKIIEMQSNISSNDRVIFTCHKADMHPALFSAGQANEEQFLKNIQNQYPGIFSKYQNQNPITKLWRKRNFDFIVFSAGNFNDTIDGRKSYSQSNDSYPAKLWAAIEKSIKGGW